jgi:hypothetical protein
VVNIFKGHNISLTVFPQRSTLSIVHLSRESISASPFSLSSWSIHFSQYIISASPSFLYTFIHYTYSMVKLLASPPYLSTITPCVHLLRAKIPVPSFSLPGSAITLHRHVQYSCYVHLSRDIISASLFSLLAAPSRRLHIITQNGIQHSRAPLMMPSTSVVITLHLVSQAPPLQRDPYSQILRTRGSDFPCCKMQRNKAYLTCPSSPGLIKFTTFHATSLQQDLTPRAGDSLFRSLFIRLKV